MQKGIILKHYGIDIEKDGEKDMIKWMLKELHKTSNSGMDFDGDKIIEYTLEEENDVL